MNPTRIFQCSLTLALLAVAFIPTPASGQVPARFYWKSLSGGNAVPTIYMDLSGNANPLDPAHGINADVEFDAQMTLAGYARPFTLGNRSALFAALVPVGRVSGSGSVAGKTFSESTSGFGDPTVEFAVNVIGPSALKNIPDVIRYEPGFSLDLLVDVIVPIGEYHDDEALNIGQNRWYGRVAAPIVWQLGAWVPGRRTTLEFLPSLWLFDDNSDFMGQNVSTDPKLQIEAHLTRDFHADFWGSLDANWISGGASTIDGVEGDDLDMLGLGVTLGYQINDNIQLTAGYMASVNDNGPTDLRMDGFKISLVFGWHPLVEGMERLSSE